MKLLSVFIVSLQINGLTLTFSTPASALFLSAVRSKVQWQRKHGSDTFSWQLPCVSKETTLRTTSLDAAMPHGACEDNINITTIANTTFRIPTSDDLNTISTHQVYHPLTPAQTFCISKNLCKHCYPQAFGFHPTAGSKLSSGLFRLSCPLLVQAIDDWEASGGVRELSDWLMQNDTRKNCDERIVDDGYNWKQTGYQNANDMQRRIRQELVSSDDRRYLVEKLGEYNTDKFMNSGIAGIPPDQTFDVKCIHAHVADHLCRVSASEIPTLDNILHRDGNVIGQKALELLQAKGVDILGNDICWQQCSGGKGWSYVARKNRRRLKSTRLRRKELKDGPGSVL